MKLTPLVRQVLGSPAQGTGLSSLGSQTQVSDANSRRGPFLVDKVAPGCYRHGDRFNFRVLCPGH